MPRDRYPLHVVVHVPPPRLHRLRRVVPIGQPQAHHHIGPAEAAPAPPRSPPPT